MIGICRPVFESNISLINSISPGIISYNEMPPGLKTLKCSSRNPIDESDGICSITVMLATKSKVSDLNGNSLSNDYTGIVLSRPLLISWFKPSRDDSKTTKSSHTLDNGAAHRPLPAPTSNARLYFCPAKNSTKCGSSNWLEQPSSQEYSFLHFAKNIYSIFNFFRLLQKYILNIVFFTHDKFLLLWYLYLALSMQSLQMQLKYQGITSSRPSMILWVGS